MYLGTNLPTLKHLQLAQMPTAQSASLQAHPRGTHCHHWLSEETNSTKRLSPGI